MLTYRMTRNIGRLDDKVIHAGWLLSGTRRSMTGTARRAFEAFARTLETDPRTSGWSPAPGVLRGVPAPGVKERSPLGWPVGHTNGDLVGCASRPGGAAAQASLRMGSDSS